MSAEESFRQLAIEHLKGVVEKKLDPKWIKSRPGGGGKSLSYIEGSRVIRLLNEACNYDWSFEVLSWDIVTIPTQPEMKSKYAYIANAHCECGEIFQYEHQKKQDYLKNPTCPKCKKVVNIKNLLMPDYVMSPIPQQFVVVRGQLTALGIIKTHIGSKTMVGGLDEMESCIKAAATDCLKKCASLFGIGLELWDSDDETIAGTDDIEYDHPEPEVETKSTKKTINTAPKNTRTEVRTVDAWDQEDTVTQYKDEIAYIRKAKEKLTKLLGSEKEGESELNRHVTEWSKNSLTRSTEIKPSQIQSFIEFLKSKDL